MKRLGELAAICVALISMVAAPCIAAMPATEPAGAPTTRPANFQDVWVHPSATSAVIYWMTSDPAASQVDYGLSAKYGSSSKEKGKNFVNGDPYRSHFHWLSGLEPGRTYHYRMSFTPEGGKQVVSEDATFSTIQSKAIQIPGDLKGPPYVLDEPGDYILTKDLSVDATAIQIDAKVNLDLDGHTITYNQKDIKPADTGFFDKYLDSTCFGIEIGNHSDGSTITNGKIVQGKGDGPAEAHGLGFNPIVLRGSGQVEIAGVDVVYQGDSMNGICLRSGTANIHNCIAEDNGTVDVDRHQFKRVFEGDGNIIHNNLIKRYRQIGISLDGNDRVYGNEMYGAAVANNHCGVMNFHSSDSTIADNYIFARSNHITGLNRAEYHGEIAGGGIYVVAGSKNIKVLHNHIYLVAEGKDQMSGVRVTWGGENILFADNDIYVTGGGSKLRGTWLNAANSGGTVAKDIVFRNNTVRVIAKPGLQDAWAISACGEPKDTDAPITLYENNRIISNICNVAFGETYGCGSNARFVNDTFVHVGNNPLYRTINIGFWIWGTQGNVFLNPKLEGGASFDKIVCAGTGQREFSVGYTLTIKTAPGATVTISDNAGHDVFTGTADAAGMAKATLIQFKYVAATGAASGIKTDLNPYTVSVKKTSGDVHKKITIDSAMEITM